MHRGRVLVVLLLIPLTLAMSGCFTLRSYSWSAKFIRPGKSVRALLTMHPVSKVVPPSGSDHVFVLVALPSVHDQGKILRNAIVEIAIKLDADSEASNTAGFAFVTGGWRDDGNDIPQDGETACSGAVYPSLRIVQP